MEKASRSYSNAGQQATLRLLIHQPQSVSSRLLDILQPSGPSQVALSVNEAIMKPARAVWHIPASCTFTPKKAEVVF